VHIDDEYEIKTDARKWVIKVVALLDHRVQYAEAIKYYTDNTPPEELEQMQFQAAVFYSGKRQQRSAGQQKKTEGILAILWTSHKLFLKPISDTFKILPQLIIPYEVC